jgi:hypothetical protein
MIQSLSGAGQTSARPPPRQTRAPPYENDAGATSCSHHQNADREQHSEDNSAPAVRRPRAAFREMKRPASRADTPWAQRANLAFALQLTGQTEEAVTHFEALPSAQKGHLSPCVDSPVSHRAIWSRFLLVEAVNSI